MEADEPVFAAPTHSGARRHVRRHGGHGTRNGGKGLPTQRRISQGGRFFAAWRAQRGAGPYRPPRNPRLRWSSPAETVARSAAGRLRGDRQKPCNQTLGLESTMKCRTIGAVLLCVAGIVTAMGAVGSQMANAVARGLFDVGGHGGYIPPGPSEASLHWSVMVSALVLAASGLLFLFRPHPSE